MAKIVRYNGGTESYYGCSNPNDLVFGKDYEVIHENDRGFQTDYILKGVNGHFNSCWFDEISPIFMAISKTIPVVGQRCVCSRLELINGQFNTSECLTSVVKEVTPIGNNIYKVATSNSIYVIQVMWSFSEENSRIGNSLFLVLKHPYLLYIDFYSIAFFIWFIYAFSFLKYISITSSLIKSSCKFLEYK